MELPAELRFCEAPFRRQPGDCGIGGFPSSLDLPPQGCSLARTPSAQLLGCEARSYVGLGMTFKLDLEHTMGLKQSSL